MLLDLITAFIVGFIEVILSAVPDFTLSADFTAGFDSVGYVMGLLAYVVPMKTFLACLAVFFMLQNITFMVMITNWIIRKIPGIS